MSIVYTTANIVRDVCSGCARCAAHTQSNWSWLDFSRSCDQGTIIKKLDRWRSYWFSEPNFETVPFQLVWFSWNFYASLVSLSFFDVATTSYLLHFLMWQNYAYNRSCNLSSCTCSLIFVLLTVETVWCRVFVERGFTDLGNSFCWFTHSHTSKSCRINFSFSTFLCISVFPQLVFMASVLCIFFVYNIACTDRAAHVHVIWTSAISISNRIHLSFVINWQFSRIEHNGSNKPYLFHQ